MCVASSIQNCTAELVVTTSPPIILFILSDPCTRFFSPETGLVMYILSTGVSEMKKRLNHEAPVWGNGTGRLVHMYAAIAPRPGDSENEN